MLIAGIILIVFVIVILALFEMLFAKTGTNQISVSGLWIFIGLHLIVMTELDISQRHFYP